MIWGFCFYIPYRLGCHRLSQLHGYVWRNFALNLLIQLGISLCLIQLIYWEFLSSIKAVSKSLRTEKHAMFKNFTVKSLMKLFLNRLFKCFLCPVETLLVSPYLNDFSMLFSFFLLLNFILCFTNLSASESNNSIDFTFFIFWFILVFKLLF